MVRIRKKVSELSIDSFRLCRTVRGRAALSAVRDGVEQRPGLQRTIWKSHCGGRCKKDSKTSEAKDFRGVINSTCGQRTYQVSLSSLRVASQRSKGKEFG